MSSQETQTQDVLSSTGPDIQGKPVIKSLNEGGSVLLVSTMKSGTHWLRYLMANYIKLMSAEDWEAEPAATYEALQAQYSPTDRRLAVKNHALFKRGNVFPFHGIQNMMWQHVDPNLADYKGRIVYISRNPLDYLVSRYFYDKDLWESEGRDVSSVVATMPYSLRWYAQGLAYMRELSQKRRIISITYEDLKAAPVESMAIVWRSLGVAVNHNVLSRAVQLSDAKQVRQEEDRRGKPIVGSTTEGNFVRNSGVGQWKEHFGADDLEQADAILQEFGLRLPQFRLEV